jgi:hypothetical protein
MAPASIRGEEAAMFDSPVTRTPFTISQLLAAPPEGMIHRLRLFDIPERDFRSEAFFGD